MLTRWFLGLTLLSLAAVPGPVRAAAAEGATTPTLVVKVRSLDGLFADIQYVAKLAGREEEAKQLQALLKSRAGPKGLEGIDTHRPLGLYASIDANVTESTGVVLVPISDEKAFLNLLENLNFKAKKEEDSIYSITPENLPVPIYLRFANGYVYAAAREKTALSKNKLLDPAKVLATKPNETLAATFRIDQIPDVFKQLITNQVEVKLAELEDQKQPGETEAQRKVRVQAAKETARQIGALINEGRELAFCLGINHQAQDVFAELSLSAKPNSQLAAQISASAPSSSIFAGLRSPSSAVAIFVHGAIPENARQQFVKSVDDAFHSAIDKEKDPSKRAVAEKLYAAIQPTLKAGELDAAVDVRGPTTNSHYAVLAALKLKDGQKLQTVLRDLRQQLPESERSKIKLDAETAGSVKIDRLDFQDQFDEQAKALFGKNPLYVAFRSDAVFVAGGDGGLNLLKDGLALQPGVLPPFKFDVSVSRLAPIMAQKQKADVKAVAQKAFGGVGKDNDRIQMLAEGGATAKFRVEIKADVIKFFSLLDKANKGEE
jgi:hypothetical protein